MTKESVSKRRKVLCSLAISLAAILMIFSFCGRYFKSGLRDFANFFVGSFGVAFYGMMIAVIVCCSCLLAGKDIRIPKKYVAHFCLLFVEIVMLVHLFSTIYFCYDKGEISISFAEYAKTVYDHYVIPTFGGIVFGIVTFGLQKVITIYATAVLLFGLLAWSVITIGLFFHNYYTGRLTLTKTSKQEVAPVVAPQVIEPVSEVDDERDRAMKILFQHQEQTIAPEADSTHIYNTAPQSRLDQRRMPTTQQEAEKILFNTKDDPVANNFFGSDVTDETNDTNDEIDVKGYYNPTMQTPQNEKNDDDDWRIGRPAEQEERSRPTPQQSQRPAPTYNQDDGWITPIERKTTVDMTEVVVDDDEPFAPQNIEPIRPQQTVEQRPVAEQHRPYEQPPQPEPPRPVEPQPMRPSVQQPLPFDFDDDDETDVASDFREDTYEQEDFDFDPTPQPVRQPAPRPTPTPTPAPKAVRDDSNELVPIETETRVPGGVQMGFDFRTNDELREAKEKVHKYPRYVAPPMDLFNDVTIIEDDGEYERNMAAAAIVNKLAVFGIKVEAAGQIVGPSVTQYRFKVLSQKTRMDEFNRCAQDLKACLEASGEIRIEAPIPGTNLVGIEVANKVRTTVTLRTVLQSKTYKEKKGNLVFVVGQQISGEMVVDDLSKLPHLLVAGTTGSGKSVFLHSLIASLMYRYGPEYLRFIMVDPKLVEFGRYNGIPHMLTTETIINATDALAAMDYLVAEMESRYQLLRQNNVANIADYNAKINPKLTQRLPYLVLVVDELADLMSISKKSFEAKLQRLAQKARAAGIHLVLATQRPDVQVISGTIKTNFPCRIALKVASATDSGTILNGGGAEKLLGNGDLLYMHPSRSDLQRIQGTYLSDDEIESLVTYVKSQNESYYDAAISKEIFVSQQEPVEEIAPVEHAESKDDQVDPYCKRALRFWLERQGGRASIASIQRTLKVGFNRAGRIMDALQKLHYVEELAPNDPSTKPLRVLVTLEQLDELFPDQDDSY